MRPKGREADAHLRRGEELSEHDDEDAEEHLRLVGWLCDETSLRLGLERSGQSDESDPDHDSHEGEPLVQEQLPTKEDDRESSDEENERTSGHLVETGMTVRG